MFDTVLPLLMALVASSGVMTALWLVQRRTGNAGIVDVAWTALVGGQGLFFAAWPEGLPWLRAVSATMIAVWSLRLTTHLFRRVIGHPEEGRYAELRRRWGAAAQRKFFSFFQMQAIAAWLFAVPIMAISRSPAPPAPWLVAIAIVTWATGIAGVAAADWQLARFKREPNAKAEVCRVGLWRYSRHPNYFFEWIHWLSYVPLAWASPWWWTPLAVAMGLLYLLLFVTGIPPTEAQSLASRGDKYREYQRRTSRFVPWPPRDS